ncbi:YibE/F family protein [Rothia sp. ARF10]|nr:YibE/F family protein [Rothia sp. ARF10]
MGSHHASRHAAPESSRMRRLSVAVVVPLALLTLAALVWMWPEPLSKDRSSEALPTVAAVVTSVESRPCPAPEGEEPATGEPGGEAPSGEAPSGEPDPSAPTDCGTVQVRITEGAGEGEVVQAPVPGGPGAPEVEEGDEVSVAPSQGADGTEYAIVDHQRASGLWVLAAAFALAVVAFGRLRGVTALLGLAVTFALLLVFVVPAILGGASPVVVSLVASSAIILVVLYLTHGFSLSTTVAVVSTLASLALTGLLSWLSVEGLHLTGITDDISTYLGTQHRVDMQGLLLAGIVIGSLGVLDDVTVSQAATVGEISRANPGYGFAPLYRAGIRVGRAHIASVINTIVLAYAGSSLPLLVLIVADNSGIGDVVTDQVIAQEIVRSAVATIGLIAAVPITTLLAVLAAHEAVPRETPRV